MALADTALKALKPKDKPYIVSDDRGLYVEVFTLPSEEELQNELQRERALIENQIEPGGV